MDELGKKQEALIYYPHASDYVCIDNMYSDFIVLLIKPLK